MIDKLILPVTMWTAVLWVTFLTFSCIKSPGVKPILSQFPNDEDQIQVLLYQYFSSWSNHDMKAFRSCFHDSARIMFLNRGRIRMVLTLNEFINQQEDYLSKAGGLTAEKISSFVLDPDIQAASVSVKWINKTKHESTTGVDRFTIIRDTEGKWKIAALVWYYD